MSNLISRERCPSCASAGRDTSHDNLAVYDDGHKYCFSCNYYQGADKLETKDGYNLETTQPNTSNNLKFVTGRVTSLSDRKITEKSKR